MVAPPAPPILNVAPSTKTSTISINDIWEKDANEYLEHIKNIKLKVKNELQKIPRSQLKEKFVLKMKVTTRIGQLQNSTSKIKEIVSAIDMILIDSKRTPIFYEWLMDITAKAMVKQSEKEVSVKRSLAFPLSTIALLLLDKHPQMLSILLGRVYKACPYAIPKYVQKVENESEIEYKKRLRYRMADDGIFEAEIQYAERITGIVCFYSALLQSEIQNPLGIAKAWEWLSRFLNMKPRRISAQLLLAFLEIAGNKLIKNYEAQARKIIRYISQVYIPMMPSSCSATKMRLELFLDDSFYKKGVIGEFEGCRPKN